MNQTPVERTEPARNIESELERFRVRDKTTIRRILSDLARHHRQTTIYFNNGEDFLLSAIIDYDPTAETLYLDCGAEQKVNQDLLHAEKRLAVSSHNHVPVRFVLGQPAIVDGKATRLSWFHNRRH